MMHKLKQKAACSLVTFRVFLHVALPILKYLLVPPYTLFLSHYRTRSFPSQRGSTAHIEVKVTMRLTVSQQSVLVSSPMGLMSRY
jgi:hypothetical protein